MGLQKKFPYNENFQGGLSLLLHPGRFTAGTYKSPMFWSGKSSEPNLHEDMFQPFIFRGVTWLDPHVKFSHQPSAPRRSDWIIGIFQPGTKWRTAKRKAQLDTTCHPINSIYGCFPTIGGKPPKWMVKIMENPWIKWMIWGENPLFLETAKNKKLSKQRTLKATAKVEVLKKGSIDLIYYQTSFLKETIRNIPWHVLSVWLTKPIQSIPNQTSSIRILG